MHRRTTNAAVGRFDVALMVLLVFVAGALRFHRLDARELWFDENCTYYIVHHLPDWPADGPPFFDEVGHIPYFGLLKVWSRLATESIWGLRSFSAIAGVLGVIAVARLGRTLGGRHVGWTAGFLMAVHPVHIHYSAEARSYAFWMLLIALSLIALCRAAMDGRRRWWAAYGILAYVAFLAHYYSLLFWPGTAAAAVLAGDRRRFWRSWCVTHAIFVVACLPAIRYLVIPLSEHGARPWFHEMWNGYPPALVIPKSLWMMLPSGGYAETCPALVLATSALSEQWRTVLDPILRWGPAIVMLGLVMAVWVRAGGAGDQRVPHDDSVRPSPVRATLMFAAIGLSFLVLSFLNSALIEPTYIVGRYDQAAFPAVVLAIAFLISSGARACTLHPRGRAMFILACTTLLCACSATVLLSVKELPVRNRHRALARRVVETVGPNDLVISVNKYLLYVLREFHEMRFAAEIVSFPPEHDRQLCWLDSEAELADPDRLRAGVELTLAGIRAALEQGRRVWVLAHGEPSGARWEVDRQLFAALRENGIDVRPTGDDEVGLAELVRPR